MREKSMIRRRGVTIAAAALSVALVAPFAQSVVVPNSVPAATAQTAPVYTATPPESQGLAIIEADAIANGYITSASDMETRPNALSGRAWVTTQGTPATFANGLQPVAEGTVVYMQWIDTGSPRV